MTLNKVGEIVTNLIKEGKLNGIINSLPKDSFPATDDMDDDFVNAGEHEDIIFEDQEKEMDKINRYFDMQNESIYEGREIDPNL